MAPTIDKRPATVDFAYRRGDTVSEPITLVEAGVVANLTGRTYRAQLRKAVDGAIIESFVVTIANPLLGQMVLSLTPAETELLRGPYCWDLEQTAAGVVRTLVAGTWTFDADVTRDPPP